MLARVFGLVVVFCVTNSSISIAQSGGGGGGPQIQYCYVEKNLACDAVAAYLSTIENQPIRVFCPRCTSDTIEGETLWTCEAANGRAVFPDNTKEIKWTRALPEFSTGNVIGKKNFQEQDPVACGQVRICSGCEPIPGNMQHQKCKSETNVGDWTVRPRLAVGSDCKTEELE